MVRVWKEADFKTKLIITFKDQFECWEGTRDAVFSLWRGFKLCLKFWRKIKNLQEKAVSHSFKFQWFEEGEEPRMKFGLVSIKQCWAVK